MPQDHQAATLWPRRGAERPGTGTTQSYRVAPDLSAFAFFGKPCLNASCLRCVLAACRPSQVRRHLFRTYEIVAPSLSIFYAAMADLGGIEFRKWSLDDVSVHSIANHRSDSVQAEAHKACRAQGRGTSSRAVGQEGLL